MSKSVFSQTKSGLLYSTTSVILRNIMQLGSVAILSRILSPKDFGIYSIIVIINALTQMFAEMGLTASIIQKKDISSTELSSANTFSILVGIVFTSGLILLAPSLQNLFNTDNLAHYIKIFSMVFIARSISMVHEAMLRRNMQFNYLIVVELVSYAIGSFIVPILMAYGGYGVLSVITGLIAQTLLQSLLTIYFSKIKYSLSFRMKELKELLNFGIPFTLGRFLMYIANQGDFFMVGKFMGPVPLGFYNRSFQIMKSPVDFLGGTLTKVLFPAFSKIKDNKVALRKIFLTSVFINSIFSLPLTCFMYFEAKNIIFIMLGKQWGNSVEPFKILILTLFFRIGYKFIDPLMNATGKPTLKAFMQFIYAMLILGGAYMGTRYNITHVSIYVSIAVTVHYILMNKVAFDELSINIKMIASEMKYGFFMSLALIVIFYLGKTFTIANSYIELALSLLVLTLIYGVFYALYKSMLNERIFARFKNSNKN